MSRHLALSTFIPFWLYALANMPMHFHAATFLASLMSLLLFSFWLSRRVGHIVVCVDSPRNVLIKKMCPALEDYSCPMLLGHGYIQTLVGAFFRQGPPRSSRYWREMLDTPDGGAIALDWSFLPGQESIDPSKPTILLLHGLAGSSESTYVTWMVHSTEQRGFQCVVLNNRGCGDSELASPRPYNGAFTGDIHLAIRNIRKKHIRCHTPLFMIGFSCGAGLTVKTLAELGAKNEHKLVNGGVACCPAFNMMHSTEHCERPLSIAKLIVNRILAFSLVKWLQRNQAEMEKHPSVDVKHALSSLTVREYDARVVVPVFGYKNVWEYYHDCSTWHRVDSVSVPLLCLNAGDDPICRPHSIPQDSFQRNPNLFLTLVPTGGHLGWLRSPFSSSDSTSWMDQCAVEFLSALMVVEENCSAVEPLVG